eukprot:1290031-Ditylum_brightwellii.AAC.1
MGMQGICKLEVSCLSLRKILRLLWQKHKIIDSVLACVMEVSVFEQRAICAKGTGSGVIGAMWV